MKHLPISPANNVRQAPTIEHVQKILEAKQNNVGASPCGCPPLGGNGPIVEDSDKGDHKGAPLRNSQTDIPALEAEIDRLVYALYGLTDDEIFVVEGKR